MSSYGIPNPKPKEKTETMPSRPKYLVEGYRWFDKVNGNTYHTVVITDLDTNTEVYCSPHMEYGYGSQFEQTAVTELIKQGKFEEKDRSNWDLRRKKIIFRVNDVNRMKDLPKAEK